MIIQMMSDVAMTKPGPDRYRFNDDGGRAGGPGEVKGRARVGG